jgi:prevent-host-death family protein
MGTAGVRELKNRLSTYLERVKRGETITVTERGRPVAALVPAPAPEPLPAHFESLIRSGELTWKGKALRLPRPVRARGGASASRMVIEDRR